MKKVFFLLFISILTVSIASAQSEWVSYKINSKLSAKFPKLPATLDENSVYAKDTDNTVYIITTIDFTKSDNLDSAKLAVLAPTADFANSIKNGMLNQMPGSTLGDVNIGKWKGYTSYNIEGGDVANKLKMYTFMVIIGTNIYGLMVVQPENNSTVGKDNFFKSLMLN